MGFHRKNILKKVLDNQLFLQNFITLHLLKNLLVRVKLHFKKIAHSLSDYAKLVLSSKFQSPRVKSGTSMVHPFATDCSVSSTKQLHSTAS